MSIIMDFAPIALKNLFSKPVTRNYPAVQREYPERSRGHIVNDFDNCILCSLCQRKCPSGAITVDRAGKSWAIDRMACVQCGNCVNGCPKKCLSIEPGYTPPSDNKVVDKLQKPIEPTEEEKNLARTDGTLVNKIDVCVLCGLCQRNCPNGAITVDRKETKTWVLNVDACVKCGLCVSKCPKKCLSLSGDGKGIITLKKPQ